MFISPDNNYNMNIEFMSLVKYASMLAGGFTFYTRSDLLRQEMINNTYISKYSHHWIYKQLVDDKRTFQLVCLTGGACLGGIKWLYPLTLGVAASDIEKYFNK
jgi:hypothetical protein